MKIRFLLDENLNPRIKLALLHQDPKIDVLRVGDLGALCSAHWIGIFYAISTIVSVYS
jgi:hypothetical protein